MHIAMSCDLTEEGNSSNSNGKRLMRDEIVERQFSKFGLPAMLHRSQAAQARLNMLNIDGLFQSLEFAFQRAQLRVMPLKQTRLKPAVEIFYTAVGLHCQLHSYRRVKYKLSR